MSNTGRFLSGCQTFYLNILSQRLTSCITLNVKIRSVSHTQSKGHCTIYCQCPNQSSSLQCSYFINCSIFTCLSTWWSNALFLFICSDQLIHSTRGLEVVSAQPASSSSGVDFPFGLHLGPSLGKLGNREEWACVLLLVGGRCSVTWGCPFFFSFNSFLFLPAQPTPLIPLHAYLVFVGIEVISVEFLGVFKCCHSTHMTHLFHNGGCTLHPLLWGLGAWLVYSLFQIKRLWGMFIRLSGDFRKKVKGVCSWPFTPKDLQKISSAFLQFFLITPISECSLSMTADF